MGFRRLSFLRKFIVIASIMTLSTLYYARTAGAVTVSDVRIGQDRDRTRLVIELDQGTAFRAFVLDAPYRVVVDLPQVDWQPPPSAERVNPLLKGYRSGRLDSGVMRIVLDVKRPLEVIEPVLIPPGNGVSRYRLVMDFKASTPERFLALKGKIFGQRDLKVLPGQKSVPALAAIPAPVPNPAPASVPVKTIPKKITQAAPDVLVPAVYAPPAPLKKPGADTRLKIIVIDAGHGGGDPGAMGPGGIIEKAVTLSMARELKRQLESTGRYKAVLTRPSDVYIPLRKRVELARAAKGDLFVSLHADKIDRKNVRGASIYTLSEKSSDEETARLADDANNSGVIAGVDLSAQSEEVADILVDLAMREKMNQSSYFAELLVKTFSGDGVRLLEHTHRSAGFAVLKAPDIPAVLIELGFLSNPEEARLLNSDHFRQRTSASLIRGIDGYFRKIAALQRN